MFARLANTPKALDWQSFDSLHQHRNNLISAKMFYEGDLQSGIAKAVQESKLVACFVTGNQTSHST